MNRSIRTKSCGAGRQESRSDSLRTSTLQINKKARTTVNCCKHDCPPCTLRTWRASRSCPSTSSSCTVSRLRCRQGRGGGAKLAQGRVETTGNQCRVAGSQVTPALPTRNHLPTLPANLRVTWRTSMRQALEP